MAGMGAQKLPVVNRRVMSTASAEKAVVEETLNNTFPARGDLTHLLENPESYPNGFCRCSTRFLTYQMIVFDDLRKCNETESSAPTSKNRRVKLKVPSQ